MTNIIKNLTARIEKRRTENKNACKNYATEAAANKAGAEMARIAGVQFTIMNREPVPARYVVFYVESWGRWVAAIDMTELLRRPNADGGYIGLCGHHGFYAY